MCSERELNPEIEVRKRAFFTGKSSRAETKTNNTIYCTISAGISSYCAKFQNASGDSVIRFCLSSRTFTSEKSRVFLGLADCILFTTYGNTSKSNACIGSFIPELVDGRANLQCQKIEYSITN